MEKAHELSENEKRNEEVNKKITSLQEELNGAKASREQLAIIAKKILDDYRGQVPVLLEQNSQLQKQLKERADQIAALLGQISQLQKQLVDKN